MLNTHKMAMKGKTPTYTWWHRKHQHNMAIFLKYNLVQYYINGKKQCLKKY